MSANARKDKFHRPFVNQGASPLEALKVATGAANAQRPYELRMDLIRVDQEIQVRVGGLNQEAVQAYTAILENDGDLPPVTVYQEPHDDGYWLADGFHRYQAHINAGKVNIMAFVMNGSREEALDYAESANLEHGLALSNEDKKNILHRRLSREHEWAQWSNGALARVLGVSSMTIKRWIDDFATITNVRVDRSVTIGADGRVRNTDEIGMVPRNRSTSAKTEADSDTMLVNGVEVQKRDTPVRYENGQPVIGTGKTENALPPGYSIASIDTGGDPLVLDDVSAMRFREAAVRVPMRTISEQLGKLLDSPNVEIMQELPMKDIVGFLDDIQLTCELGLTMVVQLAPALHGADRGKFWDLLNAVQAALDETTQAGAV